MQKGILSRAQYKPRSNQSVELLYVPALPRGSQLFGGWHHSGDAAAPPRILACQLLVAECRNVSRRPSVPRRRCTLCPMRMHGGRISLPAPRGKCRLCTGAGRLRVRLRWPALQRLRQWLLSPKQGRLRGLRAGKLSCRYSATAYCRGPCCSAHRGPLLATGPLQEERRRAQGKDARGICKCTLNHHDVGA